MKVDIRAEITNLMNGRPIPTPEGGVLQFKEAVTQSLNMPPMNFPPSPGAGRTPRETADLRWGIIQKMNKAVDSPTTNHAEFLPEEVSEILHCVSAIQPPAIYQAVKQILESEGKETKDKK